ncbi:MAG: hypothetical protein MNPFHGCM_01877 [Gemmatimonadaceae bacterium]|nr:hypothetical protein [Gemmatimonadaceae bacterium]
MATLTPDDYDALEHAIRVGRRIAVLKHGMELVVVPIRVFARSGGEAIEARHPSTGESVILGLAEIEGFEIVQW